MTKEAIADPEYLKTLGLSWIHTSDEILSAFSDQVRDNSQYNLLSQILTFIHNDLVIVGNGLTDVRITRLPEEEGFEETDGFRVWLNTRKKRAVFDVYTPRRGVVSADFHDTTNAFQRGRHHTARTDSGLSEVSRIDARFYPSGNPRAYLEAHFTVEKGLAITLSERIMAKNLEYNFQKRGGIFIENQDLNDYYSDNLSRLRTTTEALFVRK